MDTRHLESWIWLPAEAYPRNQTTIYSGFLNHADGNFTVAEFKRTYVFDKKVVHAELRFSGDTLFRLWCNGDLIATGPACVGGDFWANEMVRSNYYAFETVMEPMANTLDFFADVRMMPVQICDYSRGHGGFMLSGILTFEDGTAETVATDGTWMVRRNGAYRGDTGYDGRIRPDAFIPAEVTENIWHTETAPIPLRTERELSTSESVITLAPCEKRETVIDLDMIWAGFVCVKAETRGEVAAEIYCRELTEGGSRETVTFDGDGTYRGFYMHSAGNLRVVAENRGDEPATLRVSFIETHYPIADTAETVTDDEDINLVLETCKHTLKICRQTHHLDSPRHCEPLACTGDYNIESLMTPFSFGDMRLAEFDVIRTAVLLEDHDGRMFHTTYSLIWVGMLWDTYMATGNKALLERCRKGLELLLNRFAAYVGDNGLIETPPDYMFVDWIFIDGITMHHPPKALGQSVLNLFCFGALEKAARIFDELGLYEAGKDCLARRVNLGEAINRQLFDSERGIYFEGLNTPTEEHLLGGWMPQNVEKRYYLNHSNILAACFGVCDDDTARELVRRIMADEIGGDYQPYFTHYLLEAVYRLGLRETYTRKIVERWISPTKECAKGLVEGFVAPEPGYGFDHSHAWGGTPLYSLPKALMGLEITKPGMREITLSPNHLGFGYVKTQLMTPYGKVTLEIKQGEEPVISHPDEVAVIIK
ncbi:MAG: hypothetical protein E7610_10200 [Ruminococcaceae bacterium]|nr:hypothetical protein [Oscillospiraceae bacterium]